MPDVQAEKRETTGDNPAGHRRRSVDIRGSYPHAQKVGTLRGSYPHAQKVGILRGSYPHTDARFCGR